MHVVGTNPCGGFKVHLVGYEVREMGCKVQWTLVNPDRVNPEPRTSEVQNKLINLGVKVMFCA